MTDPHSELACQHLVSGEAVAARSRDAELQRSTLGKFISDVIGVTVGVCVSNEPSLRTAVPISLGPVWAGIHKTSWPYPGRLKQRKAQPTRGRCTTGQQ